MNYQEVAQHNLRLEKIIEENLTLLEDDEHYKFLLKRAEAPFVKGASMIDNMRPKQDLYNYLMFKLNRYIEIGI